MELTEEQAKVQKKRKSPTNVSVRVEKQTQKKVLKDLAQINRSHDFGRKVKMDAYLALAVSLVEPKHHEELREACMTNEDRLEQRYREYVKKNGTISKDAFYGLLLEGTLDQEKSNHDAV